MEIDFVRQQVGFLKLSEIPEADRTITIDREKQFSCASSKGLVGHVGFTLVHVGGDDTLDPKWGEEYNTSLTFCTSVNQIEMKIALLQYTFSRVGESYTYKIDPRSWKIRRRKADA
jgi:hypothetical protein